MHRELKKEKKEAFSWFLLQLLCPPVCSLSVFTDLSMSFGSVSDLLASLSYRQGGSGFVRIKVECWDKSCPSALQNWPGHLLYCLKTDLYRTFIKFQLERYNVCGPHINSHTHTHIKLVQWSSWPFYRMSTETAQLCRLHYEPMMCKWLYVREKKNVLSQRWGSIVFISPCPD